VKTLIASDLHIPDVKSGHREFLETLKGLDNVSRVILAGDTLDFWVAGLKQVLVEAEPLLTYLFSRFGDQFYYLLGNHDLNLEPMRKFCPNIKERVIFFAKPSNKKICVMHGHQLYPGNYLQSKTARVVAWLVSHFDKWVNTDTRKTLVSLSQQIANDPYDKILAEYEKNMAGAAEGKYDVIVTGHTHLADIKKLTDRILYVNCGDNLQSRNYVLMYDSVVELYDYSSGEPKLLEMSNI
jgi:UDP-2,3-diacylglucosamine pyrophosphatase LpxH